MHIHITQSETGNNKGSCGALVNYLEKENKIDQKGNYKDQPEQWFNHEDNDIKAYYVQSAIDRNVAKLSSKDSKFYLINISPSKKELAFLRQRYSTEEFKYQLKKYAVSLMDEYARKFNRPTIRSSAHLLWFGKVEQHRYYSFKDKEVQEGTAQRGELKSDDQWHIQIIVSRKDISNSIKLSPLNNSRGKNIMHSKKMGQFNRTAFAHSGERIFDRLFCFDRGIAESFQYINMYKKGNLKEKLEFFCDKNDSIAVSADSNSKIGESNQKDWAFLFQHALFVNPPPEEIAPRHKRKKRRPGKRPCL